MRFLIGVVVGILLAEIGPMRIALALQNFVDYIKSFV